METTVYIDGYNLFYGCLKHTDYKWLDLFKLFETIIEIQNPKSKLTKIKFFTAPVKAHFASHGDKSPQSQDRYHRALKELYGDSIEIVLGYHTVEKGTPPRYSKPINKDDRVEIWKFEEKQSDVNLSLHMYRDAVNDFCKQQILVSNDSDLEYSLKLIKQDFPHIDLGLIIPRRKSKDNETKRPPNKSLSKHVKWTRNYILNEECGNSQLPEKIPTRKKPIIKPEYW